MNDRADRHHAKAWLILVIFVEARQRPGADFSGCVVEFILWVTGRAANPGGRGETENGDCGKAAAQRDGGPRRGREKAMGQRQNRVADDPAKTGWQAATC